MTIIRTLAAALAVAALAAPAASQAKPVADMHASVAVAAAQAQRQDLRSPDARDAAAGRIVAAHAVNAPGATAVDSQSQRPLPGAPTWPADPQPIKSAPVTSVPRSDNSIDWTTVVLGIAGSLIAVGAFALIANRRSHRTRSVRATV
jgi:hypothetical protein